MIQVTVRIVQRSTRNSNSQMLVNEKNSMESNARLCTKTLAVVYFKKGLIPIVLKEGIRLSGLSRGMNRRSKEGTKKFPTMKSLDGVNKKNDVLDTMPEEEIRSELLYTNLTTPQSKVVSSIFLPLM